jgi:hypothetical protein
MWFMRWCVWSFQPSIEQAIELSSGANRLVPGEVPVPQLELTLSSHGVYIVLLVALSTPVLLYVSGR